jgi:hypothetical protein
MLTQLAAADVQKLVQLVARVLVYVTHAIALFSTQAGNS